MDTEGLMDFPANSLPSEPASDRPGSAGRELFCWLVIALVCILQFAGNWIEQQRPAEQDPDRRGADFGDVRSVAGQAKLAMAIRDLVPGMKPPVPLDVADQNTGSLWKRYAAVALVAEMRGPAAAMELLDAVEKAVREAAPRHAAASDAAGAPAAARAGMADITEFVPSGRQRATGEALAAVLQSQILKSQAADQADSPPDDSLATAMTTVRDELGWLGLVMTTPRAKDGGMRSGIDDVARSWFVRGMVAGLAGVLLLIAATAALIIAVVLALQRRFHPRMPDDSGSGTIYLETFAIWLAGFLLVRPVFVLMVSGAGMLAGAGPESIQTILLGLSPVVQLGSLIALGWPVLCGRPWRQVREDLGLLAERPAREIGCGLFGYLVTLIPLLVFTIPVAMFVQYLLRQPDSLSSQAPLHPLEDLMAGGGSLQIVLLVIMASVIAPIVEEIVFRGVLFRYLRDRTGMWWSRTGSIVASIAFSGLIFAGIHPQNLAGLVPLFSLATAMCLLRHWRGSLLAPMTLHAANNFCATMAMLVVQS